MLLVFENTCLSGFLRTIQTVSVDFSLYSFVTNQFACFTSAYHNEFWYFSVLYNGIALTSTDTRVANLQFNPSNCLCFAQNHQNLGDPDWAQILYTFTPPVSGLMFLKMKKIHIMLDFHLLI